MGCTVLCLFAAGAARLAVLLALCMFAYIVLYTYQVFSVPERNITQSQLTGGLAAVRHKLSVMPPLTPAKYAR